jgi:hypothetical protein
LVALWIRFALQGYHTKRWLLIDAHAEPQLSQNGR